MKKFKKLVALTMIMVMVLGLAACKKTDDDKGKDKEVKTQSKTESSSEKETDGKKNDDDEVTAESLMKDINAEAIKNSTMNMGADINLVVNTKEMMLAQGMTEAQIQQAIDQGNITKDQLEMKLEMKLDIDMAISEKYTYTSGDITMTLAGEKKSTAMKQYYDVDKKIKYAYDAETKKWTYEAKDEEDKKDNDEFDAAKLMEYVKSSKIVEQDKNKYVVELTLDAEKIYKEQGDVVEGAVDSTSSIGGMLDDTEGIVKALGDVKITVEISKKEKNLLAVKADFTKVLKEALAQASKNSESKIDVSKVLVINKLAMDIEFKDYGKTKVEIPKNVLDNATAGGVIIELPTETQTQKPTTGTTEKPTQGATQAPTQSATSSDKKKVETDGKTFNLRDYSGTLLGKLTIPEGFTIDNEYSENWIIYLKDKSYNDITVTSTTPIWARKLMAGEKYEPNMNLYTRNETAEAASIETNQGKVRVIVNTWSFDKEPEKKYYENIAFVLVKADGATICVETDTKSIEAHSLTRESLAKTMFN